MSRLANLFDAHLSASQKKQQELDLERQRKQDYLDPQFEFNVNDVSIVDADTVDLPNGERLRLSAGEGYALDAYETNPQTYIDRPGKFQAHRESYAKAFGLDPDDVTVEDLTIAGESQKRKFAERLAGAADENGNIRYRPRGRGQDNRLLGELDRNQINLSGRFENAGYEGNFNPLQRLEDFASGETAEHYEGSADRGLKRGAADQLVNFVGGAGRMANDLVQGAGTLIGVNNIPGVDAGHRFVRDKLEDFKEAFNSPQQLRRERLELERNNLQSEYYNVQKEKYLENGNSELHASIRAGIDEFTNSVGNIIDDPGAILDKTVESLPYMLGVAGAGRAATNAAIKSVQKEVLKRTGVQKNISKGLEKSATAAKRSGAPGLPGTKGHFQKAADLENTAAWHTQQFINSAKGQKYLKRVQGITGTTTVGLTEGLSTAAEVYDSVRNMTEEQAANSEKYLALREQGMTHDQATQELAEDAHLQTLATVTLAAGAASYITGAGAFEAQLFTGLKGVRKSVVDTAKKVKDTVKKPSKSKIIRGAKAVGRGTKATAKFLGPASAKEGTEELLQSGGGEFLSQLAKFEATGEEVGPGVGRAAGEGAVVGAASGFGAQLTLGSLQKLASSDPRKLLKSKNDYEERSRPSPQSVVDATTPAGTPPAAPEGSDTPAPPPDPTPPESPEIDTDPNQAFEDTINPDKNEWTNPVRLFLALEKVRARADQSGTGLNEKNQKNYEAFRDLAFRQFKDHNDAVLKKESKDVTQKDVNGLVLAASHGFEVDTSNLTDEQRAQVEASAEVEKSFKAAEEIREGQVENAPTEARKKTIRQVFDQKFGDVFKENGRHGLGYYNRRMRELMAISDPNQENPELDSLARGLTRFRASQNNYMAALRKAIETQGKQGPIPIKGSKGKVTFVPNTAENNGGSAGLLQLLENEQAEFERIRSGLLQRYKQWHAAANVEPAITVATPAKQETPAQTEAAKKVKAAKAARKADNAARRKEAPKSKPNPEVAKEFGRIMNDPDMSLDQKRRALISLRRKADQSGAIRLGIQIGKAHNRLARQIAAEKKQGKFSEDIDPAQDSRNVETFLETNNFDPNSVGVANPGIDFPSDTASVKQEAAVDPAELPLSAVEVLTAGETNTENQREVANNPGLLEKTAKYLRKFVEISKKKGKGVLTQAIRDWDSLPAGWGFRQSHHMVYRYGWVPPSKRMVRDLSNYIGDRPVVMPAAGLGFMAHVLELYGHDVTASDRRVAPHVWTDVQEQDAIEAARNAPENSVLLISYPEMRGDDFMAALVDAFNGEEIIYQGIKDEGYGEADLTINRKAQRKLNEFESVQVTEDVYDHSDALLVETIAFKMDQKVADPEEDGHFYFPEVNNDIHIIKLAEELGLSSGGFAATSSGIPGVTDENAAPAPDTGPATAREALQVAADQDTGTQYMLTWLRDNTTNAYIKPIIARLLEVLGDRPIRVITMNDAEFKKATKGRKAKGVFMRYKKGDKEGYIILNTDRIKTGAELQNTLVHEAVHAGINGLVDQGLSDELQKRLLDLRLRVSQALALSDDPRAEQLMKIIANDPEEMLTHAIATPWFHNFLKETKANTDRSLWQDIVKFIADMLGLPDNSALAEALAITDDILSESIGAAPADPVITGVTGDTGVPGFEAEASSEGADVGAPAPAAATENAAEASGTTDSGLAERMAKQAKARRLGEAKRLRTRAPGLVQSQFYLSNPQDRAMLQRLLNEGVEPVQAIEQVIAAIEPNPKARNVEVEPAVPQDAIDAAVEKAVVLNEKGNKKGVAARVVTHVFQDFAERGQTWIKTLASYKLGEKLSDVFARRNKKTMDMLAADNNIMAILSDPASREKFFEAIGTTPDEERALETFANFANQFRRALDATLRDLPSSSASGVKTLNKSPLYYFRDENGVLDRNVVGAMALEAMQFLMGTGAQSTWNSPEAIRSMLGLDENATITGEMMTAVGRGRTRTQVIQELGWNTLAHLNLRATPEAKKQITEVLVANLGAQILTTLKNMTVEGYDLNGKKTRMPLIYQHGVSRNQWNRIAGQTIESQTATEASDILLVSNNFGKVLDLNKGKYVRQDVNVGLREAATEGREVFTKLFGSTGNVRAPQFRSPTMSDIPTHTRNSTGRVPQEMRERQLHDAKNAFRAETKIINLIDKFESPEQFLEMAHAFLKPEELQQLHDTIRPGAEGRNDGLIRDLTEAINWARQYDRRKFYLTTIQTRNGRFMYDSNVINPQANKLHRFMFIRDGWTRHITKRNPSQMTEPQRKQYEKMMMAIGLGIGIKTEYTPVADVVAEVEARFTNGSTWQKAMEAVLTEDEKFNDEELDALKEVLSANGTHTLAALNAAAQWFSAKDGAAVEISLPGETDGVTNGYIIGLLQTPPPGGLTPEYKELLNAGGIYFDDDPWRNLAEYKAAGNLDNYQHIAHDSRKNLVDQWAGAKEVDNKRLNEMAKDDDPSVRSSARTTLIRRSMARVTGSGLVPHPNELQQKVPNDEFDQSVGRKWAKGPLMVMSYGAGVLSIIRQVIAQAHEEFYKKLAASNSELDAEIAKAETKEEKDALEATRAEVTATALNRAFSIIAMVGTHSNNTRLLRRVGTDPETGKSIWRAWTNTKTWTAEDVVNIANKRYGGDIGRLAREYTLTEEAEELLNLGIARTYGDALTDALMARLEPVMDARARLNAANFVANQLFVYAYQNAVKAREDAGEVLTTSDKREIQIDLARQGLLPALETVETEGELDSLPMTATASEYLRAGSELLQGVGWIKNRAQLTDVVHGLNGQSRIPDPAISITGRMTTRVPDPEVGVSAVVKSIHALDGIINSLLWGRGKYSVLNVHDAQVSPWWAADTVAQEANAGFVDTLAGYDHVQKFIDMAFPIIGALYAQEDNRLTQEQKDAVSEAVYESYKEHRSFLRAEIPSTLVSAKDKGRWIALELGRELLQDQPATHDSKKDIFSKMRWINQFAQEGAEVGYPSGVEVRDLNTIVAGQETETETPALPNSEPSLEQQAALPPPANEGDIEAKFSEEFRYQLESEKVLTTWEGLAEYEGGNVDPAHTNHLRNLIKNLVAPALQTMAPIFEEVVDVNEAGEHQVERVGDTLRLRAAGNVLTSPEVLSLQERAAQEYVYNIVDYGIDEDHFVRKEVRRLFELARDRLSPASFMPPLDQLTGDPSIARELAQERYDHIFNNTDPNEAYKRFMAIGLTNQQFLQALSGIDNAEAAPLSAPDWSKGILRGMLSVLRQIVQKVSGTSLRYNGGRVSDAMAALAKSTIAVNQRNQQRLMDQRTGKDNTSRVSKINRRLVNTINDRFVEPLAKGLEASNRKRLDPKNPTLPGFIRSAGYVALKSRNSEIREEYNRFYRELTSPYNIGKDNAFFQTVAEVTPWKEEDLDWIGLLRKSKYIVDMARQEVSDNTRQYINDSFDPDNHLSKAQKVAVTNVLLKTDASALLDDPANVTDIDRLHQILTDPATLAAERDRIETVLDGLLIAEGAKGIRLRHLFKNQARSLAHYQVHGETTVEHAMLNAHNIARQYMLHESEQVELSNVEAIENAVDRLASIYALEMTPPNDLRLAGEVINHEMNRVGVGEDNGFTRLVGMHIDFKELAKEKLFASNKVQMIKGYVYEIFDGDVNIEYVLEGSEREAELIAEGMTAIGPLSKDAYDDYKGNRILYRGLRGLNTYNKSIVSLTDLQHRGANLFSTNGFQSQTTLRNLANVRRRSYIGARKQFQQDYQKTGANMVPVLNNEGKIVDYRYIMNERTKRKVMKMDNPFDRVLPRMFASITDRNNSQVINKDVVTLLKQEYDAGKNNPGQRFIKIGRYPDPNATPKQQKASMDMWHLLPESMQREAKAQFGFEGMYIRDEVANLVLGFRKMTVSNIKGPDGKGVIWGQSTPVVRIAEKVWQEIVSLMRIKIAILTPAVVVGNIASNTAMLLSEGIPVNYIRKNAAEAISGMRQYQKDRRKATALMRQIGVNRGLGKDTRRLEVELARLESELADNPVAQLVQDGLFTSITADLGVDDDTIRGSLISKAEDALGNKGGKLGRAAAHLVKEAYMLPGSKGYQAAVAATQYGDFVGRYIKFKYDTQVRKMDRTVAINEALSAFIYYDIPQPKYLQALNDSGLFMFTKFFLRIQHIVARMYTQNPASAFAVLGLQKALLPDPFNENIMNYGLGDGMTHKWNNPLNLPGKVADTLNPAEPALLQWVFNPFGL